MEVNQSPSLTMDTDVDKIVKHDLIESTFKLLGISNQSTTSSKFWRAYPSTKREAEYQKLFCFPFPQEIYGEEFLNDGDVQQLLSAIQSTH